MREKEPKLKVAENEDLDQTAHSAVWSEPSFSVDMELLGNKKTIYSLIVVEKRLCKMRKEI